MTSELDTSELTKKDIDISKLVSSVNPISVNRRRNSLDLSVPNQIDDNIDEDDDNSASNKTNNDSGCKNEAISPEDELREIYLNQFECALRVIQNGLLGNGYPSLSLKVLKTLAPLSCMVISPIFMHDGSIDMNQDSLNDNDVIRIGRALQVPCISIAASIIHPEVIDKEMKSFKSSSPISSSEGIIPNNRQQLQNLIILHDELQSRSKQILDFSFRAYSLENPNFFLNPQSNSDMKCKNEAVILGSYWLDIYSRFAAENEILDGSGLTKNHESFVFVTKRNIDMMEIRDSMIAAYLHDDQDLFRNDRLQTDDELKALSEIRN